MAFFALALSGFSEEKGQAKYFLLWLFGFSGKRDRRNIDGAKNYCYPGFILTYIFFHEGGALCLVFQG